MLENASLPLLENKDGPCRSLSESDVRTPTEVRSGKVIFIGG